MKDNNERKERITLSDSELEMVAGGESLNAVGLIKCIQKYYKDHPDAVNNPNAHDMARAYCLSIGADKPIK